MGKRCRIIKYKEKRSNKPIVGIKKPPPPPKYNDSCSTNSKDVYHLWHFGEGEQDFPEVPTKPRRTSLDKLRHWVDRQRFIPQNLSDEFLSLFLSAADYSVDAAASKVEKYFFSRQNPSPLFRDRDPLSPGNVKIFKTVYVLPMPETTEDGRKIILTGLLNQTVVYNQLEHAKALAMVLDLLIWERDFGFGDFVIVLDGRGFECPQLLENRVQNHRSIKSLLLDTIPGTLRSFYLLYPPPHVAKVLETRNGIWMNVIGSKEEMRARLPADILPLEYGGNLGHLGDLIEQWELHLVQNRDFFIHFEKMMTKDYQRKLCYEKEVKERKGNWVHKMKLEADEWEYKIKYYERMKTMIPLKHPAFGSQRSFFRPKSKPVEDQLFGCRQKAKEELENSKLFEPPKLYNGYAKQIREARLAEKRQQQQQQQQQEELEECCRNASTILELQLYYSE